ncbi:fibronectin type III domain-containing protein [bacterium SCSIO 12643]|nr:fibronectin type III domain-containing protein [bacterium SCSIO 12643]
MKNLFLIFLFCASIFMVNAQITKTITPYQVKTGSHTKNLTTGNYSWLYSTTELKAGFIGNDLNTEYSRKALAYFDLGNLNVGDLTQVKLKFKMNKIQYAPGDQSNANIGIVSFPYICTASNGPDVHNWFNNSPFYLKEVSTNVTSASSPAAFTITIPGTYTSPSGATYTIDLTTLGSANNNQFTIGFTCSQTMACTRVAEFTDVKIEITHCGALGNISGLTSSTGTNSVQLSWNSVNHASSYEIYDCSGNLIGTTTSTSYTHSNLSPGTSYQYKVKPVNGCNPSNLSNCITAVTKLSTPSNLTINTNSNSSVTLNWNSSSGANYYQIYSCSGTQIANNVTGTSKTINNLQSGVSHSFKIRAVKSSTNVYSTYSSCKTVTLAPSTPVNISANPTSHNSVQLSWSPSIGANSYKIYNCNGTLIGTSNTNNYTHNGLTQLTTYTYRIKAFNSGGGSPNSNCVSTLTPIATPTGLTSIDVDEDFVELEWNPVSGASYYEIYNCNGNLIQSNINATSTFVSNLTSGNYYSFKVRAIGSGSTSFLSSCYGVYTLTKSAVVSVTTVSQSELALNWSPINGAILYRIYNCNNNFIASTTSTSYNATNLNSSTQYGYIVKSVNGDNVETSANCVTGITRTATPTGFYVEIVNSSKLKLHWDMHQNAQTIEIFDCNGNFIDYQDGDEDAMNITNLTSGTNYSFKIRAGASSSAGGASAFTSCITKAPVPKTPTNFTITPISSKKLHLQWNPSYGETGIVSYHIYDCNGNLIDYTIDETTYEMNGLKEGKYYEYYVVARVGNGNSAPTNCVGNYTLPDKPKLYVDDISSNSAELSVEANGIYNLIEIYDCNGNFVKTQIYQDEVIQNLNSSQAYHFKARVANGGGWSEFSDCVSFSTTSVAPPKNTNDMPQYKKASDSQNSKVDNNTLQVYPNPINGGAIYFNKVINASIYDSHGKLIKTVTNASFLNIDSLQNGIYIIRSENGEVVKIVKQ